MSHSKCPSAPSVCLFGDGNSSCYLNSYLRISDLEKKPDMNNVLLKYNQLSNNDLLTQINNKYSIDEYFLYVLLKNIREVDGDEELKETLIENFKRLIQTLPGDFNYLLDLDENIEDLIEDLIDEQEWL